MTQVDIIQRVKAEEAVLKTLPGLNCGLCGAPTCKTFARDVASGTARANQCVFHSKDRLEQLRDLYLRKNREPRPDQA